ncbi:MAG: YggT family protein [Marinobacterium sp.]|nr:YggT family protein [Marinobacterium sp.]
MGQDPIALIISTFGNLYAFLVVLRFLLQLAQADYYNPISQAVVKATAVPIAPLQKLLPKLGRFDLSALLLAVLVKFTTFILLILTSAHQGFPDMMLLILVSMLKVVDMILTVYFWAVLGSVIISWVAPNSYHPAPQLLQQLTEPLFALVRKVIPPLGGLDLSPIFIFLAIQIMQAQLSMLAPL